MINSFNNTNKKVAKIWNHAQKNKTEIEIVRDSQDLMIQRKNRSRPIYLVENNIVDLSTEWEEFDVDVRGNYILAGGQQELSTDIDDLDTVVKRWTLTIDGLKIRELPAIRYNLLSKFFTTSKQFGEYDYNNSTLDLLLADYYYADSLSLASDGEDSTDEPQKITFDFGVYIFHNTLVPEWLQLYWKVKLDIRLIVPNLYL